VSASCRSYTSSRREPAADTRTRNKRRGRPAARGSYTSAYKRGFNIPHLGTLDTSRALSVKRDTFPHRAVAPGLPDPASAPPEG
jgi:hypothetical protein